MLLPADEEKEREAEAEGEEADEVFNTTRKRRLFSKFFGVLVLSESIFVRFPEASYLGASAMNASTTTKTDARTASI